ncbi:hypothetical protein ACIG56_27070 [Nocardia fusca]|uniref:hypothetical protein n=1 Tax=Nocardia fusca TaxID=941183 RepID=UPI0037C941E2
MRIVAVAVRADQQKLLNELEHAVFEEMSAEQEQVLEYAESAAGARRRALGYSNLIRLKDMLLAYAYEHSDGHRPTFTTQGSKFERVEFDLFRADFDLVRQHAVELTSRAEVYLAHPGRRRDRNSGRAAGGVGRPGVRSGGHNASGTSI